MSDEAVVETPVAETPVAPAPPEKPAAAKEETPPHQMTRAQRMASIREKYQAEDGAAKPETEEAPTAEKVDEAGKPKVEAEKAKEEPNSKAFAALARQKSEVRELETKVAAERHDLAIRNQQVEHARTEVAALKANVEKVLRDPDALFEAMKAIGIVTEEDWRKHAAKQWRPSEAPKAHDPNDKNRPLTVAEMEAMQAQSARQAAQSKVYEQFEAAMADAEKYEAAPLIYSASERRQIGDQIANKLTALGKTWTIDDIADAVDEHAKEDPRYQALLKRGLPAKTRATDAGAAKPATKTEEVAPKERAGAPTVTKPAATNGAGAKLSHKERLAALKAGLGA